MGKLRNKQPVYRSTANLGMQYALKANMTPEAHERRMQGLYKSWASYERSHRGETIMRVTPVRISMGKKAIRKRIKLKETLAKEAREIQELFRQNAQAAQERVCQIITNPESRDADVLAAANLIFDRAYGKATQTNVNANIDSNGKPNEVSANELDKRIEETLNRVEAITGRAPKPPAGQERPTDVCKHDPDTGGSTVH